MSTSNTTSHSSQMQQQLYRTQLTSNGHALQQQQQSYVLATTQSQPTFNSQSMTMNGSNARVTNTQQRNALRAASVASTIQPSEIIDLSSPPSSPAPQTTAPDNVGWELKKIPERPWANDAPSVAYKVSIGLMILNDQLLLFFMILLGFYRNNNAYIILY